MPLSPGKNHTIRLVIIIELYKPPPPLLKLLILIYLFLNITEGSIKIKQEMTLQTPDVEATMNLASLNCSKLQVIVDDNKKALLANIHHAPIHLTLTKSFIRVSLENLDGYKTWLVKSLQDDYKIDGPLYSRTVRKNKKPVKKKSLMPKRESTRIEAEDGKGGVKMVRIQW